MTKVIPSELVAVIIQCGACREKVIPTSLYFEAESDGVTCPGCDGSGGQLTCLCGGSKITKTIEFQCPQCKYHGSIGVDGY